RYGILAHRDAFLPHHHVYLIIAAISGIALTPCGRSYSLDRWRALDRAEARGETWPEERGRVAALTLIAIQLTAVYFWGAFNKSTLGWLRGDKFESQLLAFIFDSDPPNIPGWHAWMVASSIATTLFEYTLAFGLWFRAMRRWLIPAGIVFHIAIYVTLPVTIFSALSCLLYLAYLDPDEVHGAIDRLSRPRMS
ncbi:MAG TPA: HTTM domain-containing protein, partial [Polyangiales bacterium]